MTGTATTYTPWGWTRDIEKLAPGVWRVATPGHGGLKLDGERWEELPGPVRDSFITPTFAEEDCEESIARTLLGLGYERERELAMVTAERFPRYAPALPYLRNIAPKPHHVIAHWGGHVADSLGCFDAKEESEGLMDGAANVNLQGWMEAINRITNHEGR